MCDHPRSNAVSREALGDFTVSRHRGRKASEVRGIPVASQPLLVAQLGEFRREQKYSFFRFDKRQGGTCTVI